LENYWFESVIRNQLMLRLFEISWCNKNYAENNNTPLFPLLTALASWLDQLLGVGQRSIIDMAPEV
jgi:hypothetical protein